MKVLNDKIWDTPRQNIREKIAYTGSPGNVGNVSRAWEQVRSTLFRKVIGVVTLQVSGKLKLNS